VLALMALLGLVGCGEGGGSESDRGAANETAPASGAEKDATVQQDKAAAQEQSARKGTKVVLGASEFGRMLFDSKKQAIYIFERDEKKKSNCYGDCAVAWPPVFTKSSPQAGSGVKSSLLGTIKRRDGRRQVTYDGKPLYYYVNEGPGEVKCHNVNLNGGFWWVVGADGERLQ
jgi:predicted lipoprotein with Yx(FWY)xxD motif